MVFDKYNSSQNTVASEAGNIVEIYQLANFFPKRSNFRFRNSLDPMLKR